LVGLAAAARAVEEMAFEVPALVAVLLAAVTTLLLFLFRKGSKSGAAASGKPKAASRRAGNEDAVFTLEEVAKHASEDDCWIVVKRDGVYKVFDVTDYVDEHPGGEAIMNNAGGDATKGFHGTSVNIILKARS